MKIEFKFATIIAIAVSLALAKAIYSMRHIPQPGSLLTFASPDAKKEDASGTGPATFWSGNQELTWQGTEKNAENAKRPESDDPRGPGAR